MCLAVEHGHMYDTGCCQYNRHGAHQTLACIAEAGLLLHLAAKDLLSSLAVFSSAAVHSVQERPQAAHANNVSFLAHSASKLTQPACMWVLRYNCHKVTIHCMQRHDVFVWSCSQNAALYQLRDHRKAEGRLCIGSR